MTARYYVYELADPSDGAVFYVGKGIGDRVAQHEREAARGKVSKKCDKIREIWARGDVVGREIVATFFDEKAAYQHEAERIAGYGLENLTNIDAGGFGGRRYPKPFKWTARRLDKIMPYLHRILSVMVTGDGNVYLLGVNVTEQIVGFVNRIAADLGAEPLKKAVLTYQATTAA